jgi:transcriptional regulator with XRE-family HTH domain
MTSREQRPAPTPRQVFGGMLRYYREKAGLSRLDLARKISKSESLISAIELGDRAATPQVTGDLEAVLAADGALLRLRDEIGDGLSYQAYPSWFAEWALKEAEADALRFFEPLVVPGILQTEGYARAVISTRFGLSSDEIEEQVAARLKRQEALERDDAPRLRVVLDEWVLRRPVGGQQVMAGQVSRLVEMATRPRVAIEVVPAGVGAHDGTTGAFGIADFDGAPGVGYQEGPAGGLMIDEPRSVALLELIWDTIRGDTLPRAASLALLEETAKSWASAT